jgi:membrane protein implicated in regulation of membrane protease activity
LLSLGVLAASTFSVLGYATLLTGRVLRALSLSIITWRTWVSNRNSKNGGLNHEGSDEGKDLKFHVDVKGKEEEKRLKV